MCAPYCEFEDIPELCSENGSVVFHCLLVFFGYRLVFKRYVPGGFTCWFSASGCDQLPGGGPAGGGPGATCILQCKYFLIFFV